MSLKSRQPVHAVEVDVDCQFIEEKSDPEQDRYLFTYTVTIRNSGTAAAKLLTRHWLITDSNNKIQEVRGDGVIGQQPRLKPGEEHHYSSAAMVETPVATMRGSYGMVDDEGAEFNAPIEQFVLSIPRTLH
jgi:ApaG protein